VSDTFLYSTNKARPLNGLTLSRFKTNPYWIFWDFRIVFTSCIFILVRDNVPSRTWRFFGPYCLL